MIKSDEEKISLTTSFGLFCFVRMPEGLCNVGPMFSRMIQVLLGLQLYRNVSTYVDDVVVRSVKEKDRIQDLLETFSNHRKHGLKLNPEKCVFAV